MARIRSPAIAALILISLTASAAQAQTARSGGGASAALMQQMQELASERTALQEELARTKKELEGVRKERDDLKKAQQAVDQRAKVSAAALSQSTSQKAAAEQELTQYKAKMQELIVKFRETVTTMRQIEADGASAKQTLAQRDQQLKVCTERNAALYKLNGDILTHWEHESAFSRASRIEGFTKIKRVELENMMDDYHDRAEDQLYHPGAATAPTPAAPPAQRTSAPQPTPTPPSASPRQ
jgi:chromosome segregation ATPase